MGLVTGPLRAPLPRPSARLPQTVGIIALLNPFCIRLDRPASPDLESTVQPNLNHSRPRSPAHRSRHSPRAFTLIELLVVISIIAFIGAVGFVLAQRVTAGGKTRITLDAIRILDTMITGYQGDVSGKLPTSYTDGMGYEYPIIDGRTTSTNDLFYNPDLAEPSLGLLLLAMGESSSVSASLKSIDSRLLKSQQLRSAVHEAQSVVVRKADGTPLNAPVIVDGWGRTIRFVHPKYDGGYGRVYVSQSGAWNSVLAREPTRPGARRVVKVSFPGNATRDQQFRRSLRPWNPATDPPTTSTYNSNPDPDAPQIPVPAPRIADADEGVCVGSQPYFYSAGEDGDPGRREDNVYTTKPTWPAETAKEP